MEAENVEKATHFHVVDYVIFVLMLCVSICIGLYYACTGGKQKTASEYLMGNRKMGKLPITLSLMASFMSSISMLGMPSETYKYGIGYFFCVMGMIVTMPSTIYLYLPVFYKLRLTSTNEYVEKRFNKALRYLSSSLFIITMVIYSAFVIYGPAISLRQVTGMNIWWSILTIGFVGTFYTAIGGIKAVMWTDVVQVCVMILSLSVICIKGTLDVGGFSELVSRNVQGERLYHISFSFDPTNRYTFWGCLIGPYFSWSSTYGVYQSQVQRYLTSPTMEDAQRSVWLNLPGMILLYILCSYIGFVLYTKYHGCDPMSANKLDAPDQITPLFVMDEMSSIPGLPGLYVAGVFSGSLSTVSSVFNSLAAVVLEDFVKQRPRWKNISEEQAAKISKLTALSFGLICLALASLGDFLGSVIQSSAYNIQIFSSAYFGIFVLGLFFPWATTKGTTIGVVVGMIIGMWMSIGTQLSEYTHPGAPTSTEECNLDLNSSLTYGLSNSTESYMKHVNVMAFYKFSYLWVSPITTSTTVLAGLAASFLTGANDLNAVDPRLLTSVTKSFLKKAFGSRYKLCASHSTVDDKEKEQVKLMNGISNDARHDFVGPTIAIEGISENVLLDKNKTGLTVELEYPTNGIKKEIEQNTLNGH